jgi:DNA-binding NarL/FixJ family response regulator
MLSNLSDPEQLNEAQAHWAIDYIVKSSWSLDEIVKKVRAAAEHPEINPN